MPTDAPLLLIIEDDRAIARVLACNLEKSGFTTHIAGDGREAKAALERHQFAFVLCDFELPDLTGEELCRHIRESDSHRNVPIALCTAKVHEIDVARLEAEFSLAQVFSKPFSVREITGTITSVLSETTLAETREPGRVEFPDSTLAPHRSRLS